ncbi:MAG: TonB family protein [Deltaproteobacteria bacterium]|nr:MAG: TonB family protein [Deltaproteobacteria bacterium]
MELDNPRETVAPWGRLAVVSALALVVQLPLFAFFESQTHGTDTASLCSAELGRLLVADAVPMRPTFARARADLCARAPKATMRAVAVRIKRDEPEPEEPPIPEDAHVVDVPDQQLPDDTPPVDTKYVSTHDTRTKKETRSRNVAPPSRKSQGSVAVKTPSPVQAAESKSPDPTVTSKQEAEIKLADAAPKLPEADAGHKKPTSVVEQGKDTRILLPATSDAAALANIQALAGDFTSNDYLPDVEQGKSTILNANRYKHADFFLRVKRAVEKHWHPAEIYRTRDPTGRAYGVKDRYTVLRVTLSEQGRVLDLSTTRNSGLDFMDQEARQAFQRAQPFPNPPEGLLNPKNEIVFEFGFYFEITAGTRRFEWRRL